MAITASSSNWAINSGTGAGSVAVTLPTSVPAGATVVVAVLNRTDETTTITDLSGSLNGAYTSRTGPTDLTGASTARLWTYTFLNSSSGTETVTATFSGSINSQIMALWFTDDTTNAMTFDTTATTLNVGTGATNIDSNTLSASGAGAIVGVLFCGNIQATLTADGAGESVIGTVTGLSGQQRIFMVFEAYASSGTYGLETTAGTSTSHIFEVLAFREPSGGASTVNRNSTRLLMMGA